MGNVRNNGLPRVYVVNPDQDGRESLRTLLRRLDCTVREFVSAEAFLAVFESGKRGCVVLELDLPGLSGLELLTTLKEHDARTPVIVLAGEGSVSAAVDAMRAGAATIVEKPYVQSVLLREVRRFLELSNGEVVAARPRP